MKDFDKSLIARKTGDGRNQTLAAHSANVSMLAKLFAEKFGAEKLAEVIGLYHDLGKAAPDFQDYILNGSVKRGKIKHSIHGAKYIYSSASSLPPAAEILSNCVISHHGVLRDYISPEGETPLLSGLKDKTADIPLTCFNTDTEALLGQLKNVLDASPNKPFALTMLTKLLYSCLVDADRFDAYLFEIGEEYSIDPPRWDEMLSRLETYLSGLAQNNKDTIQEMSALRRRVSENCAESGRRERGIYQLKVPTGGGKTLSSLRFALTHVKKHKMSRIIYVIPYLSIVEQTSREIRKALGGGTRVLEHHSNILPDEEENYKLHTDRWDEPVIVTTQVQFLESVFSAKGSDLRKMHNMADSVIIFDEIQSLPIKCIHLFNAAVNFMSRVCKSTILLCSATQTPLEKDQKGILLSENPSIADSGEAPKRCNIVNSLKPNGYQIPELAEFVREKHSLSTLVIVNTKGAAKSLFNELINADVKALHLSTDMCSAHREDIMDKLKNNLKTRADFICVSTQLIEAGVDISFECVVRDIAGLDSVYQAAGRCNRHGEFKDPRNVYVINIHGENLEHLPDIKLGADVTRRIFDEGDLSIDRYYEYYFCKRKACMDYKIDGGSIYDLLTKNEMGSAALRNRGGKEKPELRAAIKSASDNFYVIAPGREEVVVRYGSSNDILDRYDGGVDLNKKRQLLRELGRYTVSLYKYQLDILRERGALEKHNGLQVLNEGFYDENLGVNINGKHELLSV